MTEATVVVIYLSWVVLWGPKVWKAGHTGIASDTHILPWRPLLRKDNLPSHLGCVCAQIRTLMRWP